MKQLIPIDDYGMFCDNKDTARVNSLFVAKSFEKQHFHVLRDIEKLTESKSGLSEEFNVSNFGHITYKEEK